MRSQKTAFRFLIELLLLCLACALCSCATQNLTTPYKSAHPQNNIGATNSNLPRPDPGYLQWLAHQSMLRSAGQLTAQVSETELLWRNGAGGRPEILLQAAPNWLWLSARNQYAKPIPALFRNLIQKQWPAELSSLGIQGLYIADSAESASLWHSDGGTRGTDNIANATSEYASALRFEPVLGGDKDYQRLAQAVEDAGLQFGAAILPIATGLGADFILQARHVAEYGGLYAMLEVPQTDWGQLPKVSSEWQGKALDRNSLAYFGNKGMLPSALSRDELPFNADLPNEGWAASGEIQGADGKMRRWLYRFSESPLRPVLLWTDPRAQARQIISADIIRQTGLYGQSLNGLAFSPLLGLEPGSDPDALEQKGRAANSKGIQSMDKMAWASQLNPGLEALFTASREIHRYGGWALQSENLPAALTALFLGGPVDFCRQEIPSEAMSMALEQQDIRPLAANLRGLLALGEKQSRIARGIQDSVGPELNLLRARTNQDLVLELSLRLSLPGLAFFSPGELSALGFQLEDPSNSANSGKSSPAKSVDAARLSQLLKARKSYGLAMGQILAIWTATSNKESANSGLIAVITQLPDGNLWLMSANFAPKPATLKLKLPKAVTKAIEVTTHEAIAGALPNTTNLELQLDARQARHVLLKI